MAACDKHSTSHSDPPTNSTSTVELIRTSNSLPALGIAQLNNSSKAVIVSGVRKYGAAPKALQNDPFHLGSLTKSVTATILASYIAEGLLTWDTTLPEALPEYAKIMHPSHHNTTLRILIAHYSGIISTQNQNITFRIELLNMTSSAGRKEVARRELIVPPHNPSHTTFTYNNTHYLLAGLILETKLNKTQPSILQDRLLIPLNMTGCALRPLPERDNTAIDSLWPHYRNTDGNNTPTPLTGIPWQTAITGPPTIQTEDCIVRSLRIYGTYSSTSTDQLACQSQNRSRVP